MSNEPCENMEVLHHGTFDLVSSSKCYRGGILVLPPAGLEPAAFRCALLTSSLYPLSYGGIKKDRPFGFEGLLGRSILRFHVVATVVYSSVILMLAISSAVIATLSLMTRVILIKAVSVVASGSHAYTQPAQSSSA